MPGWKHDRVVLQPLQRYLLEHGWPPSHVTALSFDDALASSVTHAEEIRIAFDTLASASGASSIAIVAHSMGGLAARWYLGHSPSRLVRTVVTLATPHAGTWLAWFGAGPGAREMRPGSAFLQSLNRLEVPEGVRLVSLRAPFDTRVFPASSAWLEGAVCDVLPGIGHRAILSQKRVCRHVAALLLS